MSFARHSCTDLAPSVSEPPPSVTIRSAPASRAIAAASTTAWRGVWRGIRSKRPANRVRALLPALRERALRGEELRHLPPETFADFQAEGLFRVMQPKRYGGFELDPDTFYQAVTEVGAVCGSSGWIFAVVGVHNWHLA